MKNTLKGLFGDLLESIKGNNYTSIRFNILLSFAAKGLSVIASFITVPLLLGYLDDNRYGVWLVFSSILQWITIFDLGLGNGMRNKLAAARAREDMQLCSEYLSTGYFVSAIISLVISVLFIVSYFLFDLSIVLNSPREMSVEVNQALLILGCMQAFKFTADMINYVLISEQRIGVANAMTSISAVLVPVAYIVVAKVYQLDLVKMSFISMLIPIVLAVIVTMFFLGKRYKIQVANIKLSRFRELFGLSVKFFALQLSALIVFASDNIIISNLFTPEQVIPYNLAFRYFGIITFVFITIVSPLWSAFTKQWEVNNIEWIKGVFRKMTIIWVGISLVALVMLALSDFAYELWIGKKVEIPFTMSLMMMIFVIISTWNNIYAYFLNGVSKVKLQLLVGIFSGIVNIPLSIFFARNLGMGPIGVIMATSSLLLISFVIQPIQVKKLLNKTAVGIWNE